MEIRDFRIVIFDKELKKMLKCIKLLNAILNLQHNIVFSRQSHK